jgi:hypothetical protein
MTMHPEMRPCAPAIGFANSLRAPFTSQSEVTT